MSFFRPSQCSISFRRFLTFECIDLREQFEVRLDEGLDTFVVVDGCPVVPEENRGKLIKFLSKKLSEVGKIKADSVTMPLNAETNKTEG